jgi:hypothetical protein
MLQFNVATKVTEARDLVLVDCEYDYRVTLRFQHRGSAIECTGLAGPGRANQEE